MKTNVAPIRRRDAAAARPPMPGQVIPFPVVTRTLPVKAPISRPSRGLNAVLLLALVLACVLWELMSAPPVPSVMPIEGGYTAVTSPRALLGDASERVAHDIA